LLEWWLGRATAGRSPGRLSSLALIGLLLHLLIFSLLAADPWPAWKGLRLDTWLALAILVGFALSMLFYRLLARNRRRTRRSWVREVSGRQAD
jgi:pilus assembly protein TadC